MTVIADFPLPATAFHDKDGNHIPPHMPIWRAAADPGSCMYDPDRVARGTEVVTDQHRRALFADHLEEHRRMGEPAVTVEGTAP